MMKRGKGICQLTVVGLHLQVAYIPLHVAIPSELNVPAQPFASHDARVPQVAVTGRHEHPILAPALHVATVPPLSKLPLHPLTSHAAWVPHWEA